MPILRKTRESIQGGFRLYSGLAYFHVKELYRKKIEKGKKGGKRGQATFFEKVACPLFFIPFIYSLFILYGRWRSRSLC